jgi:hypothetical protein
VIRTQTLELSNAHQWLSNGYSRRVYLIQSMTDPDPIGGEQPVSFDSMLRNPQSKVSVQSLLTREDVLVYDLGRDLANIGLDWASSPSNP